MWWNDGRRDRHRRPYRPLCQDLEARTLLYAVSGLSWPDPHHITYSIVADGVSWDHGTNRLNAALNEQFGTSAWKRELARALQTWASVANIDIVSTTDANLPFNSPGKEQGDSRFGDIRVGGYRFPDRNLLAQTFFPPPNGVTASGDSEINLAIDWSIGGGTDLYSVMLHEFGHSLCLAHTEDFGAVMYPVYHGVRTGLTPDDIAGIQSIYGPRLPDSYQAKGQAVSFATAADLTNALDSSHHAALSGVELATIGDTEYFRVVAPAQPGFQLQVTVEAAGVSLLSPSVSVFDTSQTSLDSQANPAAWGNNVQATVATVSPSATYYIAVTGATADVFATGAYRLDVSFLGGPPPPPAPPAPPLATPPPPPPPISTPPPLLALIPPDRFESNDTMASASPLGSVSQTAIEGLTLDKSSDLDFFQFRTARPGRYTVTAPGTTLRLLNGRGRILSQGNGSITFPSARAGSRYVLMISPPDQSSVPSYSLAIAPRPRIRSFTGR
jgi:Matrixin